MEEPLEESQAQFLVETQKKSQRESKQEFLMESLEVSPGELQETFLGKLCSTSFEESWQGLHEFL